MIEQFFTEEEGPDRDWQRQEHDVFVIEDREELVVDE
jgi:hypothetical protein